MLASNAGQSGPGSTAELAQLPDFESPVKPIWVIFRLSRTTVMHTKGHRLGDLAWRGC